MTRSTLLLLVVLSVLGACMDTQGTYVANHTDKDMLLFSESNYILTREDLR